MQPLQGKDVQIGQYQLLAELGAGGMGRVYLASAPDGSLVAVKQINPQYAADEGFRARFRREVDAARKVSGAYTSSIIAADPDASTPWLASVYVPGPSLAEALDAVGVLPEGSAVQLAARLASALADIHRAGLVHRDLKPSNVLLADDGLRVIDFGIVRAADAGGGTETTLTAFAVGSPAYMSPEQAQGQAIGTASDIFSFGVLLTLACTGRHPFNVPGNVDASMRNVVEAEPDLRAIPVRLRGIVELCLEKNPADRPTPAQVTGMLGLIKPTSRPWPPGVYELIAERRAEVERLLSGKRTHTRGSDNKQQTRTRRNPGPSFEPPTHPMGGTRPDVAAPPRKRRSRLRPVLWVCAGVLVLALGAALVPGVGWELLTGAARGGSPTNTTAPAEPPPSPSTTPSPTPERTEQPPASAEPVATESPEPEELDTVVSFRESVTYEDGLKVTVSKIKHGKIGQYASGGKPRDDKTTFTIRITNGTKAVFDPSLVIPTATYGEAGTPAGMVIDVDLDSGIPTLPGKVLPGKSVSIAWSFAIPRKELGDVTLQVPVDFLDKEEAIFTGSAR